MQPFFASPTHVKIFNGSPHLRENEKAFRNPFQGCESTADPLPYFSASFYEGKAYTETSLAKVG